MKEIIANKRGRVTFCPKKLIIDSVEIIDMKNITETFNNFFVTIGPNLLPKIPKSGRKF